MALCGIPSIRGPKPLKINFRILKNAIGRNTDGVFLCPIFLCPVLLYPWKRSIILTLLALNTPTTLLASPDSNHYTPFETRDQNVFNLVHGQALPTNARLNQKAQSTWSSSLIITNELIIESNSTENLVLDYENYRFNFSYQYGINENWNIKLDIPIIHQSGGFLDSAIDNWHQFFSLPRANRPFVENDQYTIQYSNQNQNLVDLNESSTTIGDIQVALAHSLIKNEQTTMSLWGSLKLPTGDEDKLSGSGATDVSMWLALNQQLADSWLININTGAVILGGDTFQTIPLSDYTFYGHIMLGWLANKNFDLKIQLQGHTGYYEDSQLRAIGSTYLVTFGTSIKINQCNRLDIAISEDIKVDASPDASLLINWRNTSGCP
ncbi:hypothetical protein MNBD_GAMMA05-2191 [hydrothermal vent metagenome]|uniref:DUF3187 family protein n=1 Tax=hydrothermal vent metagenome TaxID=652676 RepID=A0A3B0WY67_9ZZZZ